ncbi:hypothetical protein DXG01_001094 [Tephrocybe rancida]|nr:hypothetical protein DXG01_001094 [Tephrocybe rancida]
MPTDSGTRFRISSSTLPVLLGELDYVLQLVHHEGHSLRVLGGFREVLPDVSAEDFDWQAAHEQELEDECQVEDKDNVHADIPCDFSPQDQDTLHSDLSTRMPPTTPPEIVDLTSLLLPMLLSPIPARATLPSSSHHSIPHSNPSMPTATQPKIIDLTSSSPPPTTAHTTLPSSSPRHTARDSNNREVDLTWTPQHRTSSTSTITLTPSPPVSHPQIFQEGSVDSLSLSVDVRSSPTIVAIAGTSCLLKSPHERDISFGVLARGGGGGGGGGSGGNLGGHFVNWVCPWKGDQLRTIQAQRLQGLPYEDNAVTHEVTITDSAFDCFCDNNIIAFRDEELDEDCQENPSDGDYLPSALDSSFALTTGPSKPRRRPKTVKEPIMWSTDENFSKLADVIYALSQPTKSEPVIDSMEADSDPLLTRPVDPFSALRYLACRCTRLESQSRCTDFNLMVSLIQLTLAIDIIRKSTPGKKNQSATELPMIAPLVNVPLNKLKEWYSEGTRLVYLVAADDEIGTVIKTGLLPILKGLHSRSLGVTFTFYEGSLCLNKELDIVGVDYFFNRVATNYFALPPRPNCWLTQSSPSLPVVAAPMKLVYSVDASHIAKDVLIKMSRPFYKKRCPVKAGNREEWTAIQHQKAEDAHQPQSLEELTIKLTQPGLHKGFGDYVYINSSLCNGLTLMIKDSKERFMGLLVMHFKFQSPGYNTKFVAMLKATYDSELFEDNSEQPDHRFLALHYSHYHRYAEKGHSAPKDVHPDCVHKQGVRANVHQHVPHESKDIECNPQECDSLAEFLQEIIDFVKTNLAHYLPKDYVELTAYVEELPLNARSPAYPFGGFVVNLWERASVVLHLDKYGHDWHKKCGWVTVGADNDH